MTKVMLAMLAGVFVGAFALEVLNRKRPGLVAGLEHDANDRLDEFRRAFAEGYAGGVADGSG